MAEKIPAQSGVLGSAGAWATNTLAIAPGTGSVQVRNWYNGFNSRGAVNVSISGGGNNGTTTTVAGDYLVVGITTASTNTVSAPAGWTLIQAPVGVGTLSIKVWVFAKIMTAGDLPGPAGFSIANNPTPFPGSDAVWGSVVLYQTATTPLDSSNTTESAADTTSFATADLNTVASGCSGLYVFGSSQGLSSFTFSGGFSFGQGGTNQNIYADGLQAAVSIPASAFVGVNTIRIN